MQMKRRQITNVFARVLQRLKAMCSDVIKCRLCAGKGAPSARALSYAFPVLPQTSIAHSVSVWISLVPSSINTVMLLDGAFALR